MKHGHIGEAIFDLDAAQFLLEEMQQTQGAASGGEQALHRAELEQQRQLWRQQGLAHAEWRQPNTSSGSMSPAPPDAAANAHEGTFGHAVGPTWVAALPHLGGETRVVLEYGCNVMSISPRAAQAPGEAAEQRAREADGAGGASRGAGASSALSVVLTNGRRYGVDLVIAAIGVNPALDWVPAELQRGKDWGLLVDRWVHRNSLDDSKISLAMQCRPCDVSWRNNELVLLVGCRIVECG